MFSSHLKFSCTSSQEVIPSKGNPILTSVDRFCLSIPSPGIHGLMQCILPCVWPLSLNIMSAQGLCFQLLVLVSVSPPFQLIGSPATPIPPHNSVPALLSLLKTVGWWTRAGSAPVSRCAQFPAWLATVSSLNFSQMYSCYPMQTRAHCSGTYVCVWNSLHVYAFERAWPEFLALSEMLVLSWERLFLLPPSHFGPPNVEDFPRVSRF